jgi:cGMP-specific 3',5'-cyclic phosphodiesterase, invertebrate
VIVCAELEDAIKKVQNEEIRIPFGVGIAGSVAQTKEVINITSAYEVRGQTFPKDLHGFVLRKFFTTPTCPQDDEVFFRKI